MLNRTLIVLVIVASLLLSGCHINGCNQTSEHKHLLTQMYQYFETLRAKPLRRADMARFYDPKVIMIIYTSLLFLLSKKEKYYHGMR